MNREGAHSDGEASALEVISNHPYEVVSIHTNFLIAIHIRLNEYRFAD